MERLTQKRPNGDGYKTKDFVYTEDAIQKLADYENAEEQGLLLKLPCAEGTVVYVIDNNTDACFECDNFVIGHCCDDYCSFNDCVYPQCADEPNCEQQFLEVDERKPNLGWIFNNRNKFGKTVFLTKEEAEQALTEMKGESV